MQVTSRGCSPRTVFFVLAAAAAATLAGCDMGAFTVSTTTKVLVRAQPSMNEESDYDLAARAIPGTLKTLEGFWVVNPNDQLTALLSEGFCQYGTGFVEDEWEQAQAKQDFDQMDYQAARATKMYLRCMNYSLRLLGPDWQQHIFGTTDQINKLVAGVSASERTPLMWAAVGLASAINMNKDKMAMVAQLPTAKLMLQKVVAIDAKHPPKDPMLAALPHVALGMMDSAAGRNLGGDPVKAAAEFKQALDLTHGKFLLAEVLYGRRVGVMTQGMAKCPLPGGMCGKKLFQAELLKVLSTPPSIWPEQRLANEIAHRRARRYLKEEKELF